MVILLPFSESSGSSLLCPLVEQVPALPLFVVSALPVVLSAVDLSGPSSVGPNAPTSSSWCGPDVWVVPTPLPYPSYYTPFADGICLGVAPVGLAW